MIVKIYTIVFEIIGFKCQYPPPPPIHTHTHTHTQTVSCLKYIKFKTSSRRHQVQDMFIPSHSPFKVCTRMPSESRYQGERHGMGWGRGWSWREGGVVLGRSYSLCRVCTVSKYNVDKPHRNTILSHSLTWLTQIAPSYEQPDAQMHIESTGKH